MENQLDKPTPIEGSEPGILKDLHIKQLIYTILDHQSHKPAPIKWLELGKWKDLYISQLSYSINLILGMATGSIGFCISQMSMIYKDSGRADLMSALKYTVSILMISILFGVICTLVRLYIFHNRSEGKYYEPHKIVMSLVIIQFCAFLFGVFRLGYFFVG